MKLMLLSLLAATLGGVGGYGLAPGGADAPASPGNASVNCHMTVECTPRGTCLVICYDENGAECCRQEIACDRPCEGAKSCGQE